jgi:hypothetical protein
MRGALMFLLLVGATDDELKKKLGCSENCQLLSVEKVKIGQQIDLAVRTKRSGHCGVVSDFTLLDPSLKLLLTVDEEVDRSCSGHEEHRKLRVVIDKDVVRAGDRAWKWNGEKFTDSAADSRKP